MILSGSSSARKRLRGVSVHGTVGQRFAPSVDLSATTEFVRSTDDEKTAIQALDRLDPVLPLSPGRAERNGVEYYRHGILSLYAALDVKTGTVERKTTNTSDKFIDLLTSLVNKTRWAKKDSHCAG